MKGDLRLYGRVLSYLKPYGGLIAGATVATVGFAALDAFSILMLIPFLETLFGADSGIDIGGSGWVQRLLDNTVGRVVTEGAPAQEALGSVILFILVVFLVKNVFDYFQSYLVVRLEQAVTRDMRVQMYQHLIELDLRFFGRTRAGQIITRLTTDIDQLRTMVTRNIAKFGTSVLQILITIGVLLTMSWRLTLVALVVLPAMAGIWQRMLKRLRTGDRRVRDLAGEVTSHVQETVSGIRLVKASAAEPFERRRFSDLARSYYRTFVRTESIRSLASPMTEMVSAMGTVFLLWYGGRIVLVEGAMDPTAFVTFLVLSLKMYSPAKWLAKFPSTVQPGLVAAERVFEFMDAPIEMQNMQNARPFTGVRESIGFENVGFAYAPGEPVLSAVDFEVRAGEVIALVGPSGAGKTTLADLVARFYDPTEGRITIDGVDLREFDTRSYRTQLGIVTQETVLFHDTVRNNIAYGRPDSPQEAIERAARAANAHDFIAQLAEGYDTILGERGTRLSGGQRQRIAIARAILRDPPILIFDEATSALDSESEHLVQQAIGELLQGRTVFVIAHRLSTIRDADKILVLRAGRLVEHGRHDELLDRAGVYRQLHDLQLASR